MFVLNRFDNLLILEGHKHHIRVSVYAAGCFLSIGTPNGRAALEVST